MCIPGAVLSECCLLYNVFILHSAHLKNGISSHTRYYQVSSISSASSDFNTMEIWNKEFKQVEAEHLTFYSVGCNIFVFTGAWSGIPKEVRPNWCWKATKIEWIRNPTD